MELEKEVFTAPKAKILLVDDNDMNRNVFVSLLKGVVGNIDEASSGAECLDLVQRKRYDIIYLDHMMPELDGIETFHIMQTMEANLNKDVPIIVVTANAVTGARQMYLDEGFSDYIAKPVKSEVLEKSLKSYLPEALVTYKKATSASDTNETYADHLPRIDGVDWNYAYLHIPKEEILLKMVTMYIRTSESEAEGLCELLGRLTECEDENNWNEYRIKVHSLKSTANMIGNIPLAGVAAVLEGAAKEKNISLVKDVTPYYIELLRNVKKKFADFENDENGKGAYDAEQFKILLEGIIDAANHMDVHELDRRIEKLREYEYDEEIEGLVSKLSVSIANLNISEICEISNLLIAKVG